MQSISYSKDPDKNNRPEHAEFKKLSQAGFKIIKPYAEYFTFENLISLSEESLPLLASVDAIESILVSNKEDLNSFIESNKSNHTNAIISKPLFYHKDDKEKVLISRDSIGLSSGDTFLRVKNPYPALFSSMEFTYFNVNSFLIMDKKSTLSKTSYIYSDESREKFKKGFLKGILAYNNHNPRIYLNIHSTNDEKLHGFYYGVYFGYCCNNFKINFSSEENIKKTILNNKNNFSTIANMLSAYKHVIFENIPFDTKRLIFNQVMVEFNPSDIFSDISRAIKNIDSYIDATIIECIKDIDPDKNKGGLMFEEPQFRVTEPNKFRFQAKAIYREYSIKFGDIENAIKTKEYSNYESDFLFPSNLKLDYLNTLTYDMQSNAGTSAKYSLLTQKGNIFYDHKGNIFVDTSHLGF